MCERMRRRRGGQEIDIPFVGLREDRKTFRQTMFVILGRVADNTKEFVLELRYTAGSHLTLTTEEGHVAGLGNDGVVNRFCRFRG